MRPAYILNRGEYDQPGEKVERDVPDFCRRWQRLGLGTGSDWPSGWCRMNIR